ncbi:MAG: ATP synthase F1 subunit delta [Bacillota bacterium]|nr:ATP synthase F1 subunit delta [Bacillota bacterium]
MADEACRNYASALYSLIDEARLEEYLSALGEIDSLLREDKELYAFLESYSLKAEEKYPVSDKLCEPFGLEHLPEFFRLIIKKHRINRFARIYGEFKGLANERLGVSEGIVYSVAPLGQKQISRLEGALSQKVGKKVSLSNKIETTLIGGVKVYLDGKVYDGSLRNRLLELEKTLLEKR